MPITLREQLLDKAKQTIVGERQNQYGGPEDSFKTIASFWSTYLGREIKPDDVAVMMGLLKIARLKETKNHSDSWVDLAGYAACGYEAAKAPTMRVGAARDK